MPTAPKTARTCSRGHVYYKSSDCPTCPICEKENKPESGFLALLSAPARRALQQKGIDSLVKLATYTEADILQLHGVGKTTLPVLRKALQEAGLHPDSYRD
ncbi:MAG: RNA polymerase alpha subunit C-terminal domain-containing protein [Bacteroidota bacterium]